MIWDTFLNLVKEYSTLYKGFSHHGIMGGLVPLFLTIVGLKFLMDVFKYPFLPKYGTLFLSFTRGGRNLKRKSGIVSLYFGMMSLSVTIIHPITFGIFVVMAVFLFILEALDNSRQM
ncbi:MAG: hypothetical protein K0U38_09500 [Epsilonproteobacteria bacterium]|nr:hypothetical protein [Campylobacterota bacterium]